MILRRITEHVKAQNWTAVALDFVIVVVGVFIGIQVSNWNAASTERRMERQLLSQIERDVAAAMALKSEWRADIEAHRRSLIAAVDVLQNKPAQQVISDEQCRAMWSSHLLFYPVAPLGSLNDFFSRGGGRTPQGQALRPSLLAYRDHYEVIMQLNTSLSDLANLGDTFSHAFPRRLIEKPEPEDAVFDPDVGQVERITDSTFQTTCLLDIIRAEQPIQNKLLSNLARTDGVLQRVAIELSVLNDIQSVLLEAQP